MGKAKRVKAKKKCCKSSPRCKTCPVVLNRLAKAGLTERESRRGYVLTGKIRKKDLAQAREY